MRGITPVNCNYTADNRVGSKLVRVMLDFTLVSPAPDGRLVVDLGQEYNSGQLGPAQCLYMDLTDHPTGPYHVEIYFENANQTVKFLSGTQSLLPFFGSGMGRIYAWLVDGINPVNFPLGTPYQVYLTVLNMKQPYFVSQPDPLQAGTFTDMSNVITAGGVAQYAALPLLPITKYIVGNPVGQTEPLYVDPTFPATVNSYAIMPGETWTLDLSPPVNIPLSIMAATINHPFKCGYFANI